MTKDDRGHRDHREWQEEQLSAFIDSVNRNETQAFADPTDDPEWREMLDTVRQVASLRQVKLPSDEYVEKVAAAIREEQYKLSGTSFKEEDSPGITAIRKPEPKQKLVQRRRLWGLTATAAAVMLFVAALFAEWPFSPEASAETVKAVGQAELLQLGKEQVNHPREIPGTHDLIFTQGETIRLWNPQQGEPREIPLGSFLYMRSPAPSPDGTKIAFSGYEKGSAGIWTMDKDGTNPKPLVLPSSIEESFDSPAWSPDGKTVAFTKTFMKTQEPHGHAAGREEVWLADAATGKAHKLTLGKEPAWSPDGKQLALTRTASSSKGEKQQIWLIGSSGNDAKRLTEGMEPTWSPNGRFIAFARYSPSEHKENIDSDRPSTVVVSATLREIWAIHVESGTVSQLTEVPVNLSDLPLNTDNSGTPIQYATIGKFSDWQPAWTKDGRSIWFVRDVNEEKGGHFSLIRMEVKYK